MADTGSAGSALDWGEWHESEERYLAHVGRVVVAGADLEYLLADLVTTLDPVDGRKAWGRSGDQLIQALRELAGRDAELNGICDALKSVVPKRNHVVHGLWDGPGASSSRTRPSHAVTKLVPYKKGASGLQVDSREWTEAELFALWVEIDALTNAVVVRLARERGAS